MEKIYDSWFDEICAFIPPNKVMALETDTIYSSVSNLSVTDPKISQTSNKNDADLSRTEDCLKMDIEHTSKNPIIFDLSEIKKSEINLESKVNDIDKDIFLSFDTDEEYDNNVKDNNSNMNGRKSNMNIKNEAFCRPVMQQAKEFNVECSKDCPLNRKCTETITFDVLRNIRESYFGIDGEIAPNDTQRKRKFLEFLRNKCHKSEGGKLIFNVDGQKV